MTKFKCKPCALCQKKVDIRYRIQYQADDESWILVCPDCWQEVSKDNPFYRYGGTWKAKK